MFKNTSWTFCLRKPKILQIKGTFDSFACDSLKGGAKLKWGWGVKRTRVRNWFGFLDGPGRKDAKLLLWVEVTWFSQHRIPVLFCLLFAEFLPQLIDENHNPCSHPSSTLSNTIPSRVHAKWVWAKLKRPLNCNNRCLSLILSFCLFVIDTLTSPSCLSQSLIIL